MARSARTVIWVVGLLLISLGCGRMGFDGLGEYAVVESESHLGIESISDSAKLAVLEDGVALAWLNQGLPDEDPNLWYQKLDLDGSLNGDPQLLATRVRNTVMTGVGSSLAMAYVFESPEGRRIGLRMLEDGALGEEQVISDVGGTDYDWPLELVSDGRHLALTYHDAHEVYARVMDTKGQGLTPVVQLTNDPWMYDAPSAALNFNSVAVVWTDERWDDDVFFARMTLGGLKIVHTVPIASAPGDSWSARIVCDGLGYRVMWIDEREGQERIMWAKVDDLGQAMGEAQTLALGDTPKRVEFLRLADDRFGVFWLDDDRLWFALIDAEGKVLAGDMAVSSVDATVSNFQVRGIGLDVMVLSQESLLEWDGQAWVSGPEQMALRRLVFH
ncbi:MAG: hypothetical protein JRF33_09965 [Deltaproteobacteria bacterium]|nr:hypothetical protein [Deltaproteobacteria bacterium]